MLKMGSENGNGRVEITAPRIAWWLLGIATLIIVSGGGSWLTHIHSALAEGENRDRGIAAEQGAIRERLRAVETTLQHVDATTRDSRTEIQEVRKILEAELMRRRTEEAEDAVRRRADDERRR